MIRLDGEQMTFLAGKTGLEVFERAVEFGNFHTYEWLAAWAKANTEEQKEDDSGSERI